MPRHPLEAPPYAELNLEDRIFHLRWAVGDLTETEDAGRIRYGHAQLVEAAGPDAVLQAAEEKGLTTDWNELGRMARQKPNVLTVTANLLLTQNAQHALTHPEEAVSRLHCQGLLTSHIEDHRQLDINSYSFLLAPEGQQAVLTRFPQSGLTQDRIQQLMKAGYNCRY